MLKSVSTSLATKRTYKSDNPTQIKLVQAHLLCCSFATVKISQSRYRSRRKGVLENWLSPPATQCRKEWQPIVYIVRNTAFNVRITLPIPMPNSPSCQKDLYAPTNSIGTKTIATYINQRCMFWMIKGKVDSPE